MGRAVGEAAMGQDEQCLVVLGRQFDRDLGRTTVGTVAPAKGQDTRRLAAGDAMVADMAAPDPLPFVRDRRLI